jgi:hypothetical protein
LFIVVGNKTVAAYFRSDLFDPRRRLMEEWAAFLDKASGDIEPFLTRRDAEEAENA